MQVKDASPLVCEDDDFASQEPSYVSRASPSRAYETQGATACRGAVGSTSIVQLQTMP